MTEQQTPDREKKIAEIREGYKSERDDNFTYKKEIVEQDIRFLLSELDRIEREYAEERAAHNAHVTELCQLEEENRKLREERDKLIEVLQFAHDRAQISQQEEDEWGWAQALKMICKRARDILKEIGVNVE